jgi:hypothetical protein
MSTEIWFQGQLLPPMAGGSGEDDGGGYGGDYGAVSGPTDDTGDYTSAPAESTPEPEATPEPDQATQPDYTGSWDPLAAITSPSGGQAQAPQAPQYAPAPQPVQVLQYQQANLIQQHQAEERELMARLEYYPEDQQEIIRGRWEVLTAKRERQLNAWQREQARAEMEPIARAASLDRLVEAAVKDNPGLDGKAMRASMDAQADNGVKAVLTEARRFANDYRATALKGRADKGTDRMGSGAAYSANALKGRTTTDLLSMGLQQLAQKTRR